MSAAPTLPRKIIAHNVVHMRAEPTNDSELVSQTLMGRLALVHEERERWSLVETDDTYRGWVENRWLADPPAGPLMTVNSTFADMRKLPRQDGPLVMRLPLGAAVHVMPPRSAKEEWVAVTILNGTHGWLPVSVFPMPPPRIAPERITGAAAERARDFLGTPYLWGGSSSFGLDCSGLVQLCYRLSGIILRRDADIQRDDPRFVPVPENDLLPGDLVFFGKPDRITHVGMHFENKTFIHSAGGAGVILTEWGDDRYTSHFVDARRLNLDRAQEPVTCP